MTNRSIKLGIVVFVLLAKPVAGQAPVYTNADLGRPLRHAHSITDEEYRGILARQFVYVPPAPLEWASGPRVTVVPHTPPPPPQFPVSYWETPYYADPYPAPLWFGGSWGYGRRGFQGHGWAPIDRLGPPRAPIIERPVVAPRPSSVTPPSAPSAPVRGNGIARPR
ncbi:MAG: hypothetical protein ND807_17260 [Vicinamibacterales bacterium]|nr:hypothetical protein [Vicinamibacterales bacterium]